MEHGVTLLLLAVGALAAILLLSWPATEHDQPAGILRNPKTRARVVLAAICALALAAVVDLSIPLRSVAVVVVSERDFAAIQQELSSASLFERIDLVRFAIVSDSPHKTIELTPCVSTRDLPRSAGLLSPRSRRTVGDASDVLDQLASAAARCQLWPSSRSILIVPSPATRALVSIGNSADLGAIAARYVRDTSGITHYPAIFLTRPSTASRSHAILLPRTGNASIGSREVPALVFDVWVQGGNLNGLDAATIDMALWTPDANDSLKLDSQQVPVKHLGNDAAVLGPIAVLGTLKGAQLLRGIYTLDVDLQRPGTVRSVRLLSNTFAVDPPRIRYVDLRASDETLLAWSDWALQIPGESEPPKSRVAIAKSLFSNGGGGSSTGCPVISETHRDWFRFPYVDVSDTQGVDAAETDALVVIGGRTSDLPPSLLAQVRGGLELVLVAPEAECGPLSPAKSLHSVYRAPRIEFLLDLSRLSTIHFDPSRASSLEVQRQVVHAVLTRLGQRSSEQGGVPLTNVLSPKSESLFVRVPAGTCSHALDKVAPFLLGAGRAVAQAASFPALLAEDACLPADQSEGLRRRLASGSGELMERFRKQAAALELLPSNPGLRIRYTIPAGADHSLYPSSQILLFVNDLPQPERVESDATLHVVNGAGKDSPVAVRPGELVGEQLFADELAKLAATGRRIHVVPIAFPAESAEAFAKIHGSASKPSDWCNSLKRAGGTVAQAVSCSPPINGAQPVTDLAADVDEILANRTDLAIRYTSSDGRDPRFRDQIDVWDMAAVYENCGPADRVSARLASGAVGSGAVLVRRHVGLGTISVVGTDPFFPLNWLQDGTYSGQCVSPRLTRALDSVHSRLGLGPQHVSDLVIRELGLFSQRASLGASSLAFDERGHRLLVRWRATAEDSATQPPQLAFGDKTVKGRLVSLDLATQRSLYEIPVDAAGGRGQLTLPNGRILPAQIHVTGKQTNDEASQGGDSWSDLVRATGGTVLDSLSDLPRPPSATLFPVVFALLLALVALYFSPWVQQWPWLEVLRRRRKGDAGVSELQASARIAASLEAEIQEAGQSIGELVGRRTAGEVGGDRPFQIGDSPRAARGSDLAAFSPWAQEQGVPPRAPRVRLRSASQIAAVNVLWDMEPFSRVNRHAPGRDRLRASYVLGAYVTARLALVAGSVAIVRPWQLSVAESLTAQGAVAFEDLAAYFHRLEAVQSHTGRTLLGVEEILPSRLVALMTPLGSERWERAGNWVRRLYSESIHVLVLQVSDEASAMPGLFWHFDRAFLADRVEFFGRSLVSLLREHGEETRSAVESAGASYARYEITPPANVCPKVESRVEDNLITMTPDMIQTLASWMGRG